MNPVRYCINLMFCLFVLFFFQQPRVMSDSFITFFRPLLRIHFFNLLNGLEGSFVYDHCFPSLTFPLAYFFHPLRGRRSLDGLSSITRGEWLCVFGEAFLLAEACDAFILLIKFFFSLSAVIRKAFECTI